MKKKGNFYRAVIKLLGILFLLFVGSRQHAPAFSGLPAPMLAPCSPQGLITSSGHANMVRISQVCRCPCWRRPPRKDFIFRRAAPTRPGFSRPAGVFVGADLSAKPLSFVEPRQHAPAFPDLPAPMLAPTSPQSLCPSPNRANTPWVFPICRRPCWRRPSRKAFALRRATPTRPGFSRPAGVFVGVDLLAKPLPFVEPSPTPKSIEPEICVIQNERKTALPISSRSFFTKIRSCRNYSAITVPTQALPVHAALPSSVSR